MNLYKTVNMPISVPEGPFCHGPSLIDSQHVTCAAFDNTGGGHRCTHGFAPLTESKIVAGAYTKPQPCYWLARNLK